MMVVDLQVQLSPYSCLCRVRGAFVQFGFFVPVVTGQLISRTPSVRLVLTRVCIGRAFLLPICVKLDRPLEFGGGFGRFEAREVTNNLDSL